MDLPHLDATRRLARALAKSVRPGDVIRLDGPMGAGKTTLTRFLVEALGGDPTAVASPTYTLLHRYEARIPVVHVDACRLAGPDALEGLGFAEQAEGAVAVVEWGAQVAQALTGDLWFITLEPMDGQRKATIIAPPGRKWPPSISRAGEPEVATGTIVEGEVHGFSPADPLTGILIRGTDSLLGTGSSAARTAASVAPVDAQDAVPVAMASPVAVSDPSVGAVPVGLATTEPGAEAPPRIVQIAADSQGGDSLVTSWLEAHLDTAAVRMIAYPWLAGSAVASAMIGAVGYALGGAWGFLGVVAVVSVVMSVIGSRRPDPVGQEPLLAGAVVALLWLVAWDPLIGLGVLAGGVSLIYLAAVLYRALALALGGVPGVRQADPGEPPGGWPVYTILVPLYREANVAGSILTNLQRLDYPRDRLEVKFLVEADDPLTRNALESAGIPPWAEIVVVPHALPKTKPRACNHGLARATGSLLVVFDAEDRPEPDQLKQAAAAFARLPGSVVCLQAQLAWHNHRTNLLTRWFALEYNLWFRRYLPGLQRLGAPIPLGGTSNHFRMEVLRALGGWDPFNVTEDCDLGVRLHLAGGRTACLDSTTWEEAPEHLGAWIRQRTRWLKGYLVTHLVWGRRPWQLMGRLGLHGTLGYLLAVGAVPTLAALNLLLWALMFVWLGCAAWDLGHQWTLMQLLTERDWGHERASWPVWFSGPGEHPGFALASQVSAVAAVVLLLGNVVFIAAAAISGRRPGQRGSWGPALLVPLYWLMLGVAAVRAVVQLLHKPHLWEKTAHGVAKVQPAKAVGALR